MQNVALYHSRMANETLSASEVSRLRAVVDACGGITKASRKLDLPYRALKNALDGAVPRESSALLVRNRLEAYESRAAVSPSEGGAV